MWQPKYRVQSWHMTKLLKDPWNPRNVHKSTWTTADNFTEPRQLSILLACIARGCPTHVWPKCHHLLSDLQAKQRACIQTTMATAYVSSFATAGRPHESPFQNTRVICSFSHVANTTESVSLNAFSSFENLKKSRLNFQYCFVPFSFNIQAYRIRVVLKGLIHIRLARMRLALRYRAVSKPVS